VEGREPFGLLTPSLQSNGGCGLCHVLARLKSGGLQHRHRGGGGRSHRPQTKAVAIELGEVAQFGLVRGDELPPAAAISGRGASTVVSSDGPPPASGEASSMILTPVGGARFTRTPTSPSENWLRVRRSVGPGSTSPRISAASDFAKPSTSISAL
jgi:hypothetical protein